MEYQIKNKALYIFMAFFLPANLVFAQTTRKLTLQEAIELSVRNSKELKVAGARVDQAAAEWSEAKLRRYPDVKVSGSYLRVNQPNINMKASLGSGEGTAGPAQEIKVDQVVYGMATASLPLFSGSVSAAVSNRPNT